MMAEALWDSLSEELKASRVFRDLCATLGSVVRLPIPAAAWVTGLLAKELGRRVLVVVPREVDAHAWLEGSQLVTGDREVATYFPASALTPYQRAEPSLHVRAQETCAIESIISGACEVVVTTPRALFTRLPTASAYRRGCLTLREEQELPIENLTKHLLRWGFHRSDVVVEVGQFAIRGGVFDLFAPNHSQPIRLDMFGDTIDTIRYFEARSQRSGDHVSGPGAAVAVFPLARFPQGLEAARLLAERLDRAAVSASKDEDVAALEDGVGFPGWQQLLPAVVEETIDLVQLIGDPLVAVLDPGELAEEAEAHARQLERDEPGLGITVDQVELPASAVHRMIAAADLKLGDPFAEPQSSIDFAGLSTEIFTDRPALLPREVETARSRGDRVVIVADRPGERLRELLTDRGVRLDQGGVDIVGGTLQRGFRLPPARLTVLAERQIVATKKRRRARSLKKARSSFLPTLRDLKIGDFVVHADHGVGRFVGLRQIGSGANVPNASLDALPPQLRDLKSAGDGGDEVMEISYSAGRTLLLPLARLDQVQRFSGAEGSEPRLDRLGGSSWQRTKQKIKRRLREMAEELIALYAAREVAEAPQIGKAGELSRQLAMAFEHDETDDQLEAIAAIEEDLGQTTPMDRLLCGDVGFGKTEVAIRAALQVVEGGFQVAVLAPTTILADQHFRTFQKRFSSLPVVVEMLSRFRSGAEARAIETKIKAGAVDILIGTHRLLSAGVRFANLGLLIVDEEQRFGVAHKERLKQLRKNVHVLAMSATPVPRTLQLSLAGVRDLSLIESPPRDRMAIETSIVPFNPDLVREAIEFELDRGGQVYYVYNRVESIEKMAVFLRELVPGLSVTIGHGQLEEGELARRMHSFVRGEHQLLLATTIIENGIDIPNVNTMLVHRADRFGLAQLYQLRGRVGRSDQLAFCYLLVQSDRVLTSDARKRLDAIREFTDLGAGFRVAGRDLEIRGAGNLLGAEQSGHIASVGLEVYLQMLQEAVAELKGEPPAEEASAVTLDLPGTMAIPEDYIGDPSLRMEIYQRLASGEEQEEELLSELRDRFGPLPDGVDGLLQATALKREAQKLRIRSIAAREGRLVLRLRQSSPVEPERLIDLVTNRSDVRFSPDGALAVDGVGADQAVDQARELIRYLTEVPSSRGDSSKHWSAENSS